MIIGRRRRAVIDDEGFDILSIDILAALDAFAEARYLVLGALLIAFALLALFGGGKVTGDGRDQCVLGRAFFVAVLFA